MNKLLQSWIVRSLALLLAASAAFAQDRVPFRQAELDQMLAPVALYSDSLLSHVLMASTYPLEVVQASRWSRANPNLKGQEAVRAVENMDWDPSVKSLTAFPQVLTMMDEKIDWTERLGEAFLAQQADVMDTVQGLRRRAEAAGNLKSSDQMRVAREGDVINIHQPAPEVVYVPYYNPTLVFGPWWWPAYPPFYWAPPRAYYVVPVHGPAFLWGSGIVISAGFFFGHTDWHRHHVTVAPNHVVVNRTAVINRPQSRVAWEHNPVHRRGVPFRHPEARQKFEQARIVHRDGRDAGRGAPPQVERHGGEPRSADIRQHRFEERARPAPQQDARNPRPERAAPQAGDRRGEREASRRPQARNTEPRQDAAAPVVRRESRPAVAAGGRPELRPTAPSVTAHAAPQRMLEGNRRLEPRNDGNRVQQHSAVRENTPAPRPAASAPQRAPRVESHPGGGARPQAGGNQREQSATRDGNRRS